jgi:hypothetical protein
MSMKEFTTAAKATEGDVEAVVGEDLTFLLDGDEYTAYAPTSGQLGMVMSSAGSGHVSATAAVINFVFSVLGDRDAAHLRERMFDRTDPFGVEQILEIFEYVIEEWTGRPIKQPSDFKPSHKSGGRKSTRAAAATVSTRSSSARTDT